jgi:regulator of protease activity HflC (stomatin/prohibitin superfamily)
MTTETTLFLSLAVAGLGVATILRGRYRREFIINEGFTGLLYHEGKLTDSLSAGRHVRWGTNFRLTLLDTRKTLLHVPGQEVLTADNIGVKLSVVLTTQIVDAQKSVTAADNQTAHLYSVAQTAVRSIVAGLTLEALLTQRVAIGTQVSELLAPQADAVGVRVHSAEVRDVMLPGDLRKAFSEVLKARQDGQASLERARGESAALRNLANAARLIESQPALATLRFLQTMEASSSGKTFVMSDVAALLPAFGSRGAKAPNSEPGET